MAFLLAMNTPLVAQPASEIDSLKQVLIQAKDTTKARTLFRLSVAYQQAAPDTAMQYAQQLLQLAKILGDDKGKGDGLITRGRLKREQGDYPSALEDITASLKIYQTISDSVQIANALNDISIVYAMSGNDEKALEYFKETLTIFQAIGDKQGESYVLNNIGAIYQEAGQLAEAQSYMVQSLKIKKQRKDSVGIARSYFNLGDIAEKLGSQENALRYYRQADSLLRIANDKPGRATTLNAIAELYLQKGQLSAARRHALHGLAIAQEINAQPLIEVSSQTLVAISERQKDYSSAYRYLQIQMAAKDSLYSKDQAQRLDELKTRFDSEKQESKIAMLEKDRQLQKARLQRARTIDYALIGGIILLLLLLLIVFYAYRTSRQQRRLLSLKNQEIQQKESDLRALNKAKDRFFSIISHDIKGPLNTLQGFVFLLSQDADNMDTREVKTMSARINESLSNLYQLLENLLTWSLSQIQHKPLVPKSISLYELIEEVFCLLKPTAAKKQLYLVNDVHPETTAWADVTSVSTVLRNLVANSIKFSYPASKITVAAEVSDEKIVVRVIDQGVGMDKETQEKLFSLDQKATGTGTDDEQGSGFGLVLCEELVTKNGGQLWVESKVDEGSTFTFTLPLAKREVVEVSDQQPAG